MSILCQQCNHAISTERLDIVPDTKVCGPCITSFQKQKKQNTFTEARILPLDPTPYIEAIIPPAKMFEKTFSIKKLKKTAKGGRARAKARAKWRARRAKFQAKNTI